MTQANPPKVALITGVTGQDGAYLSAITHSLRGGICKAYAAYLASR